MGNDWNKWLQERAYALWEGANRPDGRHDEHWRQAEEELRQFAPPSDEQTKTDKVRVEKPTSD
ncbi:MULTISPECIES: DUF2934 domain-containing protein [unclassified Rhizobium]|uniref:DUF2934 domain-containing protein n=1 Tax=unclassified Rhizobium TaxID=2613769 RepID=UPI00071374B4|nr:MULTISPECIES: DUF2934 domain-containing protein [unclassified Rhizobium]KQS96849.1 hypothetical protein ASG42_28630 [Rhizobium sp. Leaf391]KQT06803.1 hypothetical protein ASG50_13875 [Rhizobium sp. Leaf386]KQU05910.1 hypothetical protein ASG68_24420 [Rhizobium sp. Leaf453]